MSNGSAHRSRIRRAAAGMYAAGRLTPSPEQVPGSGVGAGAAEWGIGSGGGVDVSPTDGPDKPATALHEYKALMQSVRLCYTRVRARKHYQAETWGAT